MEVDQMIEKAVAKLQKHKHIGGKDASLRFILPLLHQMHTQYSEAFQSLSEDMDTVYETLGIGETGFIDDAIEFVQSYNGFVDKILAAAGFFEADPDKPGVFRLSPSMPGELKEELSAQQRRMVAFLQQLENLRLDDSEDDGDLEEDETESEEADGEVTEPSSTTPLAAAEPAEPDEIIPPVEVLPAETALPEQGASHA